MPVALSRDVPANTSIGTRVLGVEYVVWRDAGGTARIWDDRCPHRGMRLSLGFVRGTHIACLYHGWEYGPDGQCAKIPAHPDLPVPASISVGTHKLRERNGLIWMALDENVEWPQEQDLLPVRSMMVEASVKQLDAPDGVVVALQPVSVSQTMLHVLATPGMDLRAVFNWTLSVRQRLAGTP